MVENKIDICKELGQNFIDFSYEANSARAFADARDGLKPGQRACLWEMFDKGYLSNKPHVKSAKISGAVTGNWWPHGDVAIYETFARMSQPWINNSPEVDWHGNNGSQYTGPECASSRYTEARLSKLAEEGLFSGIKKKNVNMILNFSEDAEWPEVLPAIFPRLMVNGCQGIGSTIANVWLPHNLKEVAKCLERYIDGKEIDTKDIYPSFPTGGIIINKNDIHTIYETGKGKVILRGKAEIKNDKILITELPYQVYAQPYVEKVTEMAIKDEITGIDAVYNKSGKNKLLIEIECSENAERVLRQLYAKTDLQKNYNANQWALVGKTPKLLTLKDYCEIYVKHNIECLIREINFDLEKLEARKEILNGLLIALEDIDNIIAKIKASESAAAAKVQLKNDYNMTENQVKAVLDMKLAKLAKLEKVEIQKEKDEIIARVAELRSLLLNEDKQKTEIKNRLNAIVRKYGEDRKTELAQIEMPKEDKEIQEVIPEDCVVVMSKTGLIKRVPTKTFKPQKRGGKGNANISDAIMNIISTNTIDNLLLFTNKGKMYRLLVDMVPEGTNSSKGMDVNDYIMVEPGEKVIAMTSLNRNNDSKYVCFITKNGLVKKTAMDEYKSLKRNTGLVATKIAKGDSIADVQFLNEEQLILITSKGMSIRFNSKEIGATGRATMGVKGIKLAEGDYVVASIPVQEDTKEIAIFMEKGQGKKILITDLVTQVRGGKGVLVAKISETIGALTGAAAVKNENNIILIGDNKSICISASEIPLLSRVAIGNKMTQSGINSIVKI